MADPSIYKRPSQLLQHLIRFNTTNPPGNELACVQYLNDLLQAAGVETTILAKDANRPNLIARLPGSGSAPPLLMQGHVDVVTTADQKWQQDPFAGELIDGWIWGRGCARHERGRGDDGRRLPQNADGRDYAAGRSHPHRFER